MAAKRVKVKPGKAQSKMGFVVGIIFVIIGLVAVIPMAGPFGILWTGIACFITYSHYKNGFSDEGFPTHEIIIDDETDLQDVLQKDGGESDGVFSGTAEAENIEARLRTLNSLYDQGLISNEEYEIKRKEIINSI